MPNVFEILGLEPSFDIDREQLEERFLDLTAANHPDRFTDPLEQADAADRAAAITGAYRTLSDDESRANALLALLGGPSAEEDKSLPPDLLMEMMEVREALEAATAAGDAAELNRLRQWATDERAARLETIERLFGEVQASTPPPRETLEAIRLELNAMRYVERMLEQMV